MLWVLIDKLLSKPRRRSYLVTKHQTHTVLCIVLESGELFHAGPWLLASVVQW